MSLILFGPEGSTILVHSGQRGLCQHYFGEPSVRLKNVSEDLRACDGKWDTRDSKMYGAAESLRTLSYPELFHNRL